MSILFATTLLAGCGHDDGPATDRATIYDIVCLRDMTSSGTTFTLTKPAGTSLITYRAAQRVDTTRVHLGDRCMLAYTVDNGRAPYTTGTVTARGYSLVTNERLRIGNIGDMPGWDRDPVYMISMWQSEDFLNMRLSIPYDTEPRTLMVVIDESTIGNEYPDCYLIHHMDEQVNSFSRAYYLSVDMSALRRLDNCRGFNLHLNDSNLKTDSYRFELLEYK